MLCCVPFQASFRPTTADPPAVIRLISFLLIFFRTLLLSIKSYLSSFQSLPHSFPKSPGWVPPPHISFHSVCSSHPWLVPLESTHARSNQNKQLYLHLKSTFTKNPGRQ